MKTDSLNYLRIASPCPANWESMKGDDRVRFCELCNLNVYNFAELTPRQASRLIAGAEGRLCGRLFLRADGTIITKNCPVGLRAIRHRVARASGAIFATLVSLSAGVFAGTRNQTNRLPADPAGSSSGLGVPSQTAMLNGIVTDMNGAAIQDATVTLTDIGKKQKRTTRTDKEGRYAFVVSEFGGYRLRITAPPFKPFEREMTLHLGDEIKVDAMMEIGALVGDIVIIKPRESGLEMDGVRVTVRNH